MNILVTGGAGYIGSIVARQLIEAGERVVIYDNLSKGHRAAIAPEAVFVRGDVADRALVEQTLCDHRIEAVMHFAALIEAGESMEEPAMYFRNNTVNALTLLEAMLAQGVDNFVFSSTAALYGDPERIPIKETDRLAPTNAYGASKLMVEEMLRWFNQIHGLRYASLRYFNAAGAVGNLGEGHRPESHLIPRLLSVALGQVDHAEIFGTDYPTPDGTCIRDFIHVADLSAAHLLALRALAERDRLIYNLGSGQGFSVRQVIDAVRRVTGQPVPVVEAPRRPGDPAVLVASSEKISRELGWQPRYPDLEIIVESSWRWRLDHPNGYED